jgi:hypothetical protein
MTDIEELARRFAARALRRDEWTHAVHLAIGCWFVTRYGADGAIERLRTGICRLNETHGTINSPTSGYHETITRAYVRILADFLAACPPETTLQDRIAAVTTGPLAQKDLLSAYYSRDRLMSPRARLEWIEPDLKPLP